MSTNLELRNREPLVRTITPDRLRAVASEHDVLGLVREYLGEWMPEEIAQLPSDCRPGNLRDGDDLSSLAVSLARASNSFALPPETLYVVEELDVFVGLALRRVAQRGHLRYATSFLHERA